MIYKNLTYRLFIVFWPLIMLNYFLLMRTGYNLTLLFVYAPLVFFAVKAFEIWSKNKNNQFIVLLGLYACYVLASVVCYAFNGTPIVCYYRTILNYFLPICFAFIGYSLSDDNKYYKYYLYSCAFCFIVGFYLMATFPPYYVEYLQTTVQDHEDFGRQDLMESIRFCSFLGSSYNISYISIPALILSLSFASKPETGIKKWLCYVIAMVSFVAAIICQQRIAIFFAIIIVLFYSYYILKHGNNKLVFVYILLTVLIVSVVGSYIQGLEVFDSLRENVLDRFHKMDVSVAMSSRTGQYTGFSRATWWSYIIGLGMGSCGHLVIPFNLEGVYDGEFVKTFYEFGIIGSAIFALLVLLTLVRGIKLFKYLHQEFFIMLFFLGACVGASALTFFIFNSMFWFAMGRIWNKGYLNMRREYTRSNSIQ